MGPRPDGRGRRDMGAHVPLGRKEASMGPRPDGRGRQCTEMQGYVANASFNGAAAGWPRKGQYQVIGFRAVSGFNGAAAGWPRKDEMQKKTWVRKQLQWGRGRMAAEGAGRPGAYGAPAASMGPRPDGRGRMLLLILLGCGRDASMGPRPDGRGRPLTTRHVSIKSQNSAL